MEDSSLLIDMVQLVPFGQVPWPVDVVISSKCQAIYNQIFTFLLQVKRAKYCLDELRFCGKYCLDEIRFCGKYCLDELRFCGKYCLDEVRFCGKYCLDELRFCGKYCQAQVLL